jgi:predicted permease
MTAESNRPDGARRAFRLPRAGAQVDAQVNDELQFHIEERIEELMAQGRTRQEAEAEARRRFGDVARWRKEASAIDRGQARDEQRADLLDTLRRETRQGLRALLRAPGFSLVALLTLALGLGAATAIFAVLDAVVLRPLPYPAADRLVWLDHKVPEVGVRDRWALGEINYYDFRDHVPALASIGLYNEAMLNATVPGGPPVRVRGAFATASLFPTLGGQPLLGRLFTDADNARGARPVAVLGYDFWQRAYGGDSAIGGRTVELEGAATPVVGVAAPGVALPQAAVDVWLPMELDSARAARVNQHTYAGIARLREGATPAQLLAQLQARERRFTELYPRVYSPDFMSSTGFSPAVTPLHEHVVGETVTRTLWIMFGAVGLVLLVACAHVANLFLVRLEAGRRETAVRTALGASRGKLAWRSLTESLLLTLAAALLGIALAWAALRGLLALAPASLPRLDQIHLGWPHVAFVVLLALVVGAAFGVLPLLRGDVDLGALRDQSRGSTVSRQRTAVRGALVVGQVALSLVLLAAGGLMLRSAARLHAVPPGFDAERVLVFDLAMPGGTYQWGDYEKTAALQRTFLRQLAASPGIVAAGISDDVPMGTGAGNWGCSAIAFEDDVPDGGACLPGSMVSPGYFEAMRIPLVRGRAPTWDEVAGGGEGVVVSRALAEHFWPGQDPIGKGLKGNGNEPPYFRVVGVTGDVRLDGLEKPPTEVIYFPMVPDSGLYLWGAATNVSVMVRTTSDDASAPMAAARRIMQGLDPNVVVDNARWMRQVVAASLSRTTLAMLLLSVAAGMALLLSAVGIYGVIAYIVGQRRGEIGIRLALGASAGRVGREVVLGAVRLAVIGVAIGLVGAVAATRLLQSLLYDVSPTDPWTLGAVAVLLLALAALASWVPARRAARVAPMEALRTS